MLLKTSAETIKVPQMAESLTEGTLREFNYEVGDYVENDAEVASIETVSTRNKPSLFFAPVKCIRS